MKTSKLGIFVIYIILLSETVFLQQVKTLRVYSSQGEISFPIIILEKNNSQKLIIEFDVDSDVLPNMNIVFKFCNRDWIPYSNIFLQNYGKNVEHDLDFEILPFTCKDARYHFKGVFPNSNDFVDFPFSGKWMFFITDVQDTSKIYASGKFFVINYSDVNILITAKRESLEDKTANAIELARIVNVTCSFNLPKDYFPNYVDHIEIIQNRKINLPYIVNRTFNTNTRQYSWNGDRKFSFTIRDIFPGNEYRQADFRDINKFNSENINANFAGFDMSRFFQFGKRDFNGGFILTNYKNDFAEYLNVNFRVKPPEEFEGDIFLVGPFNNWTVSSDFKMEINNGIYSKVVRLKRGVYDYQYVTGFKSNEKIVNENWIYLEGNFWETSNEFHAFLWYNDPNYGGYDRIIGFNKIITK